MMAGFALGKGGIGSVYLVTDPETQHLVALKTMHATLSEDPSRLARASRNYYPIYHATGLRLSGQFEPALKVAQGGQGREVSRLRIWIRRMALSPRSHCSASHRIPDPVFRIA